MKDEEFQNLIDFAQKHQTKFVDFGGAAVTIGSSSELTDGEHIELESYLRRLGPWRKGPFEIFGHRIDANWKSDIKWDRIKSFLDPLAEKCIADVGCNNGYYMFRMLDQNPASILGLDPRKEFSQMFGFFSELYPTGKMKFIREGYEALQGYKDHFDMIFCMGVIYHHPEPIRILRILHNALKSGGQLILETMGIPERLADAASGMSSHCIFPDKKYAGVGSVWFVPTSKCLESWLHRSAYRDIQIQGEWSCEGEQVRTEYAEIPSFEEGLSPDDPSMTVEGYPAPVRIFATARK